MYFAAQTEVNTTMQGNASIQEMDKSAKLFPENPQDGCPPQPSSFSKSRVTKTGGGSGRAMKFPYTYSAKLAQFPFKFYFKNNWIARYYLLGVIISFPVFLRAHKMSNSPGNKAIWAEIRRKEAQEHHH